MMKKTPRIFNLAIITAGSFYSASAFAEEFEEVSGFSYVPIALLFALLIVLRKRLIAEAIPEIHGEEGHHEPESVAHTEQPETTSARQVTKAAPSATAGDVNDVSVNAKQCQGTTAKGSRCSRTTNLETIDQIVNGKKYRFSTCKQHNNETFKPFWSCLGGEKP